jgi:aminoglycoside/choline kinase family phosphotransferase/dTDP-glucose pyrophosphorylase
MRAPRKAFILAAGLGTRLRPLTLETPKPMLPLWGEPMLARTLAMLARWGVEQVLINLHHAPGPIVRYLATQPFPQLRISAVFEPDILGTGGALRNARWFIDEPFWLLNADVVADVDPAPLLRAWQKQKPLAACWLTADAGPKTVRCERGVIRDFHDPAPDHATFCGLQLLDPRILPFIAPAGFDTLVAAYRRAQKRGHRIAGVLVPGSFWADIGTPAQYVQAHRDTAQRLGHAGENFTLPAAAVLTPREQRLLSPISSLQSPVSSLSLPIEVLPPRGSNREFFRLPVDANACTDVYKQLSRSLILIRWSPERADNRFYARHTRFLAALDVPVPRLFLDAPRDRFLAIEDLGPATLETRRPRLKPAELARIYRWLLAVALRLHRAGLPAARRARLPLMPGFDAKLYAWEHAYFIEHVLRARLRLPERQIAAVAAELETVAAVLAASPQGLIHRDFQSSNVLFRGAAPVLIDYQGMRRGPVAYDLASLLCDPYADLAAPLQQTLLRHYAARHPQGAAVAAAFPAAAIQRLGQALGAYAVLSQKPGMERFARHIPAAARQLLRALRAQPLPALAVVARRLAQSPP